jgi:hypothetical protein
VRAAGTLRAAGAIDGDQLDVVTQMTVLCARQHARRRPRTTAA